MLTCQKIFLEYSGNSFALKVCGSRDSAVNSSLGSRLKTGWHSGERLANGGWNLIMKRRLAAH